MWAGIGRDVAEEDDVLDIEAVDEGGESVPLDVADGQHECLDPRRGDGKKGIDGHGCAVVMSSAACCGSEVRAETGGRSGQGQKHVDRKGPADSDAPAQRCAAARFAPESSV